MKMSNEEKSTPKLRKKLKQENHKFLLDTEKFYMCENNEYGISISKFVNVFYFFVKLTLTNMATLIFNPSLNI